MQTTSNILLIKPSSFIFNNETAISNSFQKNNTAENLENITQKAIAEFELFAATLKNNGINVFVFEDTEFPQKPDAIFPNNWVSFHKDGTVILYPMLAVNRRAEKRMDIIESLKKSFVINAIKDLSVLENDNKFLEGTGSMIFDHQNRIVFACLSPRTSKELFEAIAEKIGFKPIHFYAHNENGVEIYHTNVMMSIGEGIAVVCTESITNKIERETVINSLIKTNHQIIDISIEQMNNFAGNMLMLKNNKGKNLMVLSSTAFKSLTAIQKKAIEKYCSFLPMQIDTIETIGGGSARCMIAEIFCPLKKQK